MAELRTRKPNTYLQCYSVLHPLVNFIRGPSFSVTSGSEAIWILKIRHGCCRCSVAQCCNPWVRTFKSPSWSSVFQPEMRSRWHRISPWPLTWYQIIMVPPSSKRPFLPPILRISWSWESSTPDQKILLPSLPDCLFTAIFPPGNHPIWKSRHRIR